MRRLQVGGLIHELAHLVRRFFGFLTARPLAPSEQRFVHDALSPELARLFSRQRVEDQRHAMDMAKRVAPRPELVEAALMHDVGKVASGLGAIGRSLATIGGVARIPLPTDWTVYLEHGPIGAAMLEASGAGRLAVAFARSHPGPVPNGIDPEDWAALAAADAA